MLNDGRSSHKTKIAGKIHVTRMILKKKKELGWDLCSWGKEKFPHLRGQRNPLREGVSEAQRRVQQLGCGSKNSENFTEGLVHLPSLPSSRHPSAGVLVAGCWNSGFREQTQGEEWGCVGGDSTRGWRVVQATTRPVHRKDSGSTIEVPLLTRAWREEWGPAIAGLFSVWLKLVQLCLYEF